MARQKLLDLVICFVVWFAAQLAIHELFHDLALFTMGYGGLSYIKYYFPLWTGTDYLPAEAAALLLPWQEWAWSAAGGLGTALFAGAMWWRAMRSPTHWDLDDEAVTGVLAVWHLGRIFTELFGFYWAELIIIAPLVYYTLRVVNWLEESHA